MPVTSIYILLLTAAAGAALWISGRLIKGDQLPGLQQWILIIASLLFAAWSDWRFALILLLMCLTTWLTARRKSTVKYGILLALLALAWFKYLNFFLDSFRNLLGQDLPVRKLLLPLGISFYTFSAVSYLADVYRGKLEARSFREVAVYLTFFPKLTSGPIARSGEFLRQMEHPRRVGAASLGAGIQIFLFGLFKKVVLADRLSVFVDQVYGAPLVFSSLTVALAVLAYAMQIYLDFSGYSDMAIGIAKILDVDLPANFNLPYFSRNVTEFWKRWHITLSSWLQDYLYIPLGGSRRGQVRTYVNLILTMTIGGLWHGASWTYVIWGLLHGLALMVHKLWRSRPGQRKYNGFTAAVSTVGTFLFVSLCWIFFRAESLPKAMTILYALFSFRPGVQQLYVWLFAAVLLYLVCGGAAACRSRKASPAKPGFSPVRGFYPTWNLSSFWGLTALFVLIGLILGLAYTGGSPFIYGGY